MPAEDENLTRMLQAAGRGDQRAFKALYDRTAPLLFGIVLRILRNRATAEEVLQDAYLRIWRSAYAFSADAGSPLGWMAAIARNRAIDVARQRREVPCLDGRVLCEGAVAIPVREAEHPLSNRQPRRAIAEAGDHSGQFVSGDRRRSVTVEPIGPSRRPTQLSVDESRRMNLNDDIVDRCLRLGKLRQLHSGRSRRPVRHNDCLHRPPAYVR